MTPEQRAQQLSSPNGAPMEPDQPNWQLQGFASLMSFDGAPYQSYRDVEATGDRIPPRPSPPADFVAPAEGSDLWMEMLDTQSWSSRDLSQARRTTSTSGAQAGAGVAASGAAAVPSEDAPAVEDDGTSSTETLQERPPKGTEGMSERMLKRERNREHARRSRLRKKMLVTTLQALVLKYRAEVGALRTLVSEHVPNAESLLAGVASSEDPTADDNVNLDSLSNPLPAASSSRRSGLRKRDTKRGRYTDGSFQDIEDDDEEMS